MAGFVVTMIEITDQDRYGEVGPAYAERVPGHIASYGAIPRARGGKRLCYEGPEVPERIVVAEFESLEKGLSCYGSAEYAEISKHVKQATEFTAFAVEGEALSDLDGAPGYFIARLNVLDWDGYEAYSSKAAPMLKDWGAGFIAAGPLVPVTGHNPYERCVLIRFPSLDEATKFRTSAAYRELIALRDGKVEMQHFAVEGTS